MNDIAKQLRKIRRAKDISQEGLAATMGKTTTGYISLLENGRRNPTLNNLILWVDALGYKLTLEPKE